MNQINVEADKMANKEFILQQCEVFLNENNIGRSRYYKENGECVGIEIEQWTDGGVDMIHLIDGRDRDMNDPDWWKDELEAISEAFKYNDYPIYRTYKKLRIMTIENLTASQREQLKITVLEDVLGYEPSWNEVAWADEIVSDEYIEEEFAGVHFVEEDFWS